MAKGIFDRVTAARPSQLAAVADRRFDDARVLCESGDNARANGAQYLAGLVIEILLKAQLMRQYPNTSRKRSHELDDADQPVWSLIWRSHDLADMLDRLPATQAAVHARGALAGRPYGQWLAGICSQWTIYARYSTQTSTIAEAREMLERVRELKEVLK
jgi:hypothetical protein